jgi:hypothetical protein
MVAYFRQFITGCKVSLALSIADLSLWNLQGVDVPRRFGGGWLIWGAHFKRYCYFAALILSPHPILPGLICSEPCQSA